MIEKIPTKPKKKRTRRKKTTNHYFTQVHEDAIVKYSASKCSRERTQLYVEFIAPAFDDMVDKIVYTYRFTSLPNIEVLQDECKIWLTTILDKFDPSKGSKAFSYFSVITKNWFIHKTKKSAQRSRREVQYDDLPKELEQEHLSTNNSYMTKREEMEFWSFLMSEMEGWSQENLKENERKVLQAVKILFENIEDIEIFNKKAIYLYIREITGLNTKQVVNNLNKIRAKYQTFKKNWNEGEV